MSDYSESIIFCINIVQGIIIFILGVSNEVLFENFTVCAEVTLLNAVFGSIFMFILLVAIVSFCLILIYFRICAVHDLDLPFSILDKLVFPKFNNIVLTPCSILWALLFPLVMVYDKDCDSLGSLSVLYVLLALITALILFCQIFICLKKKNSQETDVYEV